MRATATSRLHARGLGYDPTLFGYTDIGPDPRTLAPRRSAAAKAMRACCRASRCASFCPSIRSSGCPGSPRAASMPAPAIPTSIGRSGHEARDHQRAADLFEGRDASRLPGRRIHPLAGEQERHAVVRAHLLHSVRTRPSSCLSPTTPCTIRMMVQPSAEPSDKKAERRDPSLSRLRSAARPRSANFVPGAKGKVATGATTSSARSARSITA